MRMVSRARWISIVGDIGFDLGGDAPVQVANNRAFYADAGGQDVDLVVMPTPSGVESFAQIRSVDAPEEVRMGFDLPAGTQLRAVGGAADGALEVVRGGEVIATVTRPMAVDAQQRPVPVQYRVEGNDLVMTVEHRSGDFAMPIMLDPSVVYGWNDNPRRYDSTGWGVYQSNPASRWCSYFGDAYAGYGQYTFGRPESYQPCSSTWYSANEVYEFNYYGEFARGSTAFVEGWNEGTNFDAGWGGTCRYSGVYSVALERWETFSGNECETAWNRIRYHRSPGTPPNYAVFGTLINGSGLRQNFTNQLWGATVFVSDRENPTVEQGPRPIPTGWTKDTVIDVTARDSGIGVDWTQIRLSTPGQPDHLESRLHPCSADPANHCPSRDDFAYATNNMPEGIRTLSAQAGDLIRQSPFSELGTVKIDRTAPVIVDFPDTVRPGSALPAGVHRLTVRADDTGTGGATNSGVKKFEFSIDGGGWSAASATCASGPCSHSFSVDARADTGLDEGEHTVRVRVADEVGLISPERAFKIVVDRTAPSVELGGELFDSAHEPLTGEDYDLLVEALDGTSTSLQSGVTRIEVRLDGSRVALSEDTCPEDSCEMDLRWEFRRGNYPTPGSHRAEVIVTDGAGNEKREVFDFVLSATRTGAPPAREGDASTMSSRGPTAANGVGPGCPQVFDRATAQNVVRYTNDTRLNGFETTAYYSDGSYRVAYCDLLGTLTHSQHVGPVAVPTGSALLIASETLPISGTSPVKYRTTFYTYGDPSDPYIQEVWAADREEILAQVLPPTTVP
jgi:hypothetical protein